MVESRRLWLLSIPLLSALNQIQLSFSKNLKVCIIYYVKAQCMPLNKQVLISENWMALLKIKELWWLSCKKSDLWKQKFFYDFKTWNDISWVLWKNSILNYKRWNTAIATSVKFAARAKRGLQSHSLNPLLCFE